MLFFTIKFIHSHTHPHPHSIKIVVIRSACVSRTFPLERVHHHASISVNACCGFLSCFFCWQNEIFTAKKNCFFSYTRTHVLTSLQFLPTLTHTHIYAWESIIFSLHLLQLLTFRQSSLLFFVIFFLFLFLFLFFFAFLLHLLLQLQLHCHYKVHFKIRKKKKK